MHAPWRRLILPIMFLLTTVLVGCAGSASTGRAMHHDIVAQGTVYDDPALQAYVDRVGQRLVAASGRTGTTYTFTVIDSPDINAFALPGGYIYVNRGLLAYLESEAELAGVLGHEIGHVAAAHHNRHRAAAVTNKVVATTAYVITGSGGVAQASSMYGAELVSGYGREMELEADGLAAKYMHQAGYNPESLLDVIGVLKDQEQYQRLKAREGGKPVAAYHGLYATHPRNDQRLKQVVTAADGLDERARSDDPSIPGEFQRHIDGLVWGDSVQSTRADNRYYHNKLGFTFEQPPGWTVDAGAQAIRASAADDSASVTVTVARRAPGVSPRATLEQRAAGPLAAGSELAQAGLTGYTAIAGSGADARRVAVIEYNGLDYLFDGRAREFPGADATLLALIESFRPTHPAERQSASGYRVHYIEVPPGTTIASLAASSPLPDAEAQLRLLNGLYPRGEPRGGDWIKVVL